MFQKIKPKKISEEVYEQIKELILSGQIQPGEKLPAERELAVQLGVSRPSLREAINKLDAQGFVEQIHGGGTYVRSIINDPLEIAMEEFVKRDDAILDLIEVRKILETWAAELAAERATDEEIKHMQEYLEEMRDAKERGEVGHLSDANFHSAIFHGTHNVLLIHVMNTIFQWIERVSYEVRSRMYTKPESHEDLFKQHIDIFESISSRNPELAREKMSLHMDYVRGELHRIFSPNK
jgi:GntR family transcriptional repressor for pyruvate dehydrogenase complex